ncbi:MAG: inorganic phosphate transporter, partial [Succinivibrionaceae bacterium]|nr:inorganic phosphate transporter [Succinivibrionaceae bacterium]
YLRYKKFPSKKERKTRYENVERVFTILLIITACAMAFAHGSNDVANAVGPLAAVAEIVNTGEDESLSSAWLLSLGAFGIVLGLATLGYQVMKTIGTNITHLTPSRGFAAQLATATTVVIASGTGLPISTTQTMVGAVMGVGLARGISAINLSVVRKILVSWVVTLPAGAVFAVLFYFLMAQIFC